MHFCIIRVLRIVAVIVSGLLLSTAYGNGDFALLDQHGQFHQLSRYAEHDAVLVLIITEDDETSGRAVASLHHARQQLAQQAPDASITYLLLYAEAEPERAAVQAMADALGTDLPVLLDEAQIVLSTLAAERIGELLVLAPGSQDVLYRGALGAAGNNGDVQVESLQRALAAIVAGTAVTEESIAATGPAIDYRFQQQWQTQPISYQHDIAPLLQRRCAHCHVEQGLAPWAMNRHLMVLGWSPMMREVVITRRMPPGQIDGYIGDWQQTHELPAEELAMLIHWIDQGAPQDGEVDPLAESTVEEDTWPLGEPDLIVDVPAQELPATGVVDFLLESAELSLPEDKWLRAVAYDVGDKSVLHSLMIYARDASAPVMADTDLIDPEVAQYVSIFVPGERVDAFPQGAAYLLRAGRHLAFKIRYLTSGRETVDRTRIGLYFQEHAPEMTVDSQVIANEDINIPAGVAEHREVAQGAALASDVYLSSFSPHAHGRATSMQLSAVYPSGARELIANVANYNFNWQLTYRLQKPVLLPAGTRLEAETVYNNSLANPLNADPGVSVQWGLSDQDEMFNHYVRILRPR